jgi:hypothetical protein
MGASDGPERRPGVRFPGLRVAVCREADGVELEAAGELLFA